jgi:hypothetical protein
MLEEYRGYRFYWTPKPVPSVKFDYEAVHDDYDGPGDNRHFTAASGGDLRAAVDHHIKESLDERINSHPDYKKYGEARVTAVVDEAMLKCDGDEESVLVWAMQYLTTHGNSI